MGVDKWGRDNPMYGLKKSFIKKTIGQFGLAPGQIKKMIVKSCLFAPESKILGAKTLHLNAKTKKCDELALDGVYRAIFGCKIHSVASPIFLDKFQRSSRTPKIQKIQENRRNTQERLKI